MRQYICTCFFPRILRLLFICHIRVGSRILFAFVCTSCWRCLDLKWCRLLYISQLNSNVSIFLCNIEKIQTLTCTTNWHSCFSDVKYNRYLFIPFYCIHIYWVVVDKCDNCVRGFMWRLCGWGRVDICMTFHWLDNFQNCATMNCQRNVNSMVDKVATYIPVHSCHISFRTWLPYLLTIILSHPIQKLLHK
jgi:hypothetical protein